MGRGSAAGGSQGHRMHYVDEGSGPVVVCLHGNPTWGFLFRNLIAALRDDFRVIVPDHIGCGLSDQPGDVCFRAGDRIGHLEDLLTELGIELQQGGIPFLDYRTYCTKILFPSVRKHGEIETYFKYHLFV